MKELRQYRRAKSFLRGLIYDCRKRGAMDCMIRDLSEDGARIALSQTVALPEMIELDIPQRELRRRARVVWRRNDEVGLCFSQADRMPDLATMTAEDITARIGMLEAEIVLLRERLSSLNEAETEAGDEAVA
jgi:PilZ domain